MRHAMKKPAERCAFQCPTHCTPLSIELDWENQCNEQQRSAAEERQLRVACLAGERCAFQQEEQSKQCWQRKCGWHETGNSARVRSANELVDKIKVQWTCKRCCRPRNGFSGKPLMENERKDREQGIKPEIPDQRQRCAGRIKMFKMPRMLQPEYGDERDGREQIERKDFAHAEKQDHQQQRQTEYRRRIYQW